MTSSPTTTNPAPPAAESSVPHRQRASFHLLRVSAIDRLTDDSAAITFEVPRHLQDEYDFAAGQHLAIRATLAGDDVRRNYSICAPAGSGLLRIGVKRLPDGVFSSYALDRLQVGDTLEVLSPNGTFGTGFDPLQAKHYGAIGAGSGITPILSILASALAAEPDSRATLILVNATSRSIMFLEDLEDLKNRYLGRLQLVHVLSRERQDAELLSGRLDPDRFAALLDGLGATDVDDWFLCGPMPLTDMVRQTLLDRGMNGQHIRRELFHVDALPPRPRPAAADVGEEGFGVTVVLDGRATEFTMAADSDSVLDAARQLRAEIPYACKNGVCGTCRCKLVSGTVEMAQNYALEAAELKRGYVLACQSYPTSGDVVMDFDQ